MSKQYAPAQYVRSPQRTLGRSVGWYWPHHHIPRTPERFGNPRSNRIGCRWDGSPEEYRHVGQPDDSVASVAKPDRWIRYLTWIRDNGFCQHGSGTSEWFQFGIGIHDRFNTCILCKRKSLGGDHVRLPVWQKDLYTQNDRVGPQSQQHDSVLHDATCDHPTDTNIRNRPGIRCRLHNRDRIRTAIDVGFDSGKLGSLVNGI